MNKMRKSKIRPTTIMFIVLGAVLSGLLPNFIRFAIGELIGACIVWSIIYEW